MVPTATTYNVTLLQCQVNCTLGINGLSPIFVNRRQRKSRKNISSEEFCVYFWLNILIPFIVGAIISNGAYLRISRNAEIFHYKALQNNPRMCSVSFEVNRPPPAYGELIKTFAKYFKFVSGFYNGPVPIKQRHKLLFRIGCSQLIAAIQKVRRQIFFIRSSLASDAIDRRIRNQQTILLHGSGARQARFVPSWCRTFSKF